MSSMSILDRRYLAPVAVALVCLVAFFGCRNDELSSSEEQAITDIFRSGLENQQDPFVRSETLRIMGLTDDPRLADHAAELTRDDHAVVRIAALRNMVHAGHPLARQRAQHIFNHGDENERYQVLDICLTDGSDTLRRTMLERALRTGSPRLRLRALEDGLFAEIEQAREDGNDELLRRELFPALGKFVDDDDAEVAAIALESLLEAGQTERAESIVERFSDRSNSTEERIDAARILFLARVEQAREPFQELLARVGAFDPDALGIPERAIDSELLRLAVLGLASLGDTEFVQPAQEHLDDAEADETIEVLHALALNPSTEAAVTLRTHMRDARTPVRRQAIALYGQREDASPDALLSAMRHDDYEAQTAIVSLLTERFPDAWQDHLARRLDDENPNTVEATLRTMQTLLRTDDELAILIPLQDQLQALATDKAESLENDDGADDKAQEQLEDITDLAAYVLFRISDEGSFADVIRHNPDRQTRYAYLEFLATNEPAQNIDTLREYLYDDLFVLRLMAAAGLWRAFSETITWRGPAAEGDEEDE